MNELRKQNIADLAVLLNELYTRGPKGIEALETVLSDSDDVPDYQVATLVDNVANLNEWLGLS